MIPTLQTPIHLQASPFPQSKVKNIREWLKHAGARDYVEYLVSQAAHLAAISGNSLVGGGDNEKVDAEAAAKQAREFLITINLLQTHAVTDYSFETADIKPNPQIRI